VVPENSFEGLKVDEMPIDASNSVSTVEATCDDVKAHEKYHKR
jgi:hypothetical protein